MTRAIHLHPRVVRSLPWPRGSQCLLNRQGLYPDRQTLVTSSSPVSIQCPSRDNLPILINCPFLYCSFRQPWPVYSCRPTYDHAAKRIPPIGENQNHMRHNEENEEPHDPEMPCTRRVKASK